MKNIKWIVLVTALLSLIACSQGSGSSGSVQNANAVVVTTAADYSSGAHSIISKEANGTRMALNDLVPAGSDLTVAAHGAFFYRIGRAFAGNNITKFASSTPQTKIWQYSTNDSTNSAVASNPYDMIFVSDTKAYVLRYGSAKTWIVNPSATTQAGFKTGELDLSAYAGTDGTPDMASGVIVNGKLYIILQRLDNFNVVRNGYIAVFDTTTDKEIDENIPGNNLKGIHLKGIPLAIRDPAKIIYQADTNSLYVQGNGSFFPMEYTGGIEKINLNTLQGTVIVDDGNATTHPYGLITGLAVVSANELYFVGYNSFTDNTLYKMNIKTGNITPTAVSSLLHGQITYLTVDDQGLLWVSDSANATVRIIDPVTDTQVDALSTDLNPGKIVFTQ